MHRIEEYCRGFLQRTAEELRTQLPEIQALAALDDLRLEPQGMHCENNALKMYYSGKTQVPFEELDCRLTEYALANKGHIGYWPTREGHPQFMVTFDQARLQVTLTFPEEQDQ